MRSEDHLALGLYLLSRENSPQLRRHCIAFLIGCIEPDYNQFSYLRGIVHHRKFRGHNAENSFAFLTRCRKYFALHELSSAWDFLSSARCSTTRRMRLHGRTTPSGRARFWTMSGTSGRCIRCSPNSCVQSPPKALPALTRQVYMKPTRAQNTAWKRTAGLFSPPVRHFYGRSWSASQQKSCSRIASRR